MNKRVQEEFESQYGSYTPASYRDRLQAWFRDGYDDEFGAPTDQPPRNAEELGSRRIGDAERIACTLLAKTDIAHPIARWWVERIVNDPIFALHLDEFARQAPDQWLAFLRPESPDWDDRGLHIHTSNDVAWLFIELGAQGYALTDVWTAIVEHRALPQGTSRLCHRIDRAAVILADAIVDHRLYREPDTEHTESLYSLVNVMTSLAAAVVEFHFAITNAFAARNR